MGNGILFECFCDIYPNLRYLEQETWYYSSCDVTSTVTSRLGNLQVSEHHTTKGIRAQHVSGVNLRDPSKVFVHNPALSVIINLKIRKDWLTAVEAETSPEFSGYYEERILSLHH
jgi:hypothetical protein